MRKENTIFTSSASVSEQKEHFMLSSSPSLIPHLLKKKDSAGRWSKEVFGGCRGGGGINFSRFLSQL